MKLYYFLLVNDFRTFGKSEERNVIDLASTALDLTFFYVSSNTFLFNQSKPFVKTHNSQ